MIDSTLSHYKITAELGRGGMGIVYRATDTKLNREVALKILPAAALASEEDRARFFREAQAAAQLHHPNIATVFEIDEAILKDADGNDVNATDGPRPYIAMEFISGKTLQETIKKAPLKLSEVVNITSQVAEALKAAHAKEIVHRDIKSPNVMITEDGIAKVLDFGLAKTNQSTMLTRMGSTLGTVAYMSPEQARGQEVDGRSDLYSLGTMMYEMIAGKVPFSGEYEQAVVYGILNESPEHLTAVRTGVPMQLEWIVNKLLAKEADYRYQSAAGLLADLKTVDISGSGQSRRSMPAADMAGTPSSTGAGSGSSMPVWGWAIVAAALVVGVLGSWFFAPTTPENEDTAVRELFIELPEIVATWSYHPSPDGKTLAFSGADSLGAFALYFLDLDTKNIRHFPDASGDGLDFSPNGSRFIYGASGANYVMPSSGGSPTPIEDSRTYEAKWMEDESIIYVDQSHSGIWIAPQDGEEPFEVVAGDSTSVEFFGLHPLPGNRYVLLSRSVNRQTGEMHVLDITNGSLKPLGVGGYPQYLASGHLLYKTGDNQFAGPLMVRPFDLDRLEFDGPAVTLRQQISILHYESDQFGTWYEIPNAENRVTDQSTHFYSSTEAGAEVEFSNDFSMGAPRLSPGGVLLAYSVDDEQEERWLEIRNLVSGVPYRLTFSGDVLFSSWSAAHPGLIMIERDNKLEILSASLLSLQETLPIEQANEFDWSPDGRYVVYIATGQGFGPLRMYDRETEVDLLLDEFSRAPRFSPDGQFIAYTKFDNGFKSFVRSAHGTGGRELSVDDPSGGVGSPVWSSDGKTIFVTSRRGGRGYSIAVDIT